MEIPDYKAKALYTHLRRILGNVKCDPADTRTFNALRLARQDLRDLEKRIIKAKEDV